MYQSLYVLISNHNAVEQMESFVPQSLFVLISNHNAVEQMESYGSKVCLF